MKYKFFITQILWIFFSFYGPLEIITIEIRFMTWDDRAGHKLHPVENIKIYENKYMYTPSSAQSLVESIIEK